MSPRRPLFVCALFAVVAGCGGQHVELGNLPASGGGGAGGQAGAGVVGGAGGMAAGTGDSGSAGVGGAGAPSGGNGGAGGMGTIRLVDASGLDIDTESIEDNPTLTRDGLQMFFTSDRDGTADVWVSTRASPSDFFVDAVRVDAASTDAVESSPAISPDGLTLFVGLDEQAGGLGGYDIWALERPSRTRAWSSPIAVFELNSPEDDIPRPLAMESTLMPLGSRRSLQGYRTYLAKRPTPADPFGAPMLIEELAVDGQSTVDGFLTEDGLMLFFSSAATENEGDLFYAVRPSDTEPFGPAIPLVELNTGADERDPFLSTDGGTLYFSTDREGTLDIYTAKVSWE